MQESLIIALGTIGFALVLMCPFIINKLTKYKIEIEKLKLEADVRKEEIRARNQLELDMFMAGDHVKEKAAASDRIEIPFAGQGESGSIFRDRSAARSVDLGTAMNENSGRERVSRSGKA